VSCCGAGACPLPGPVPSSTFLPVAKVSQTATYLSTPVNSIDLADTTYLLRPGPDDAPEPPCLPAIADHGILHPPLLLEVTDGRKVVLSGRRRVVAAVHLGMATIPALVLPAPTPMARRLELLAAHARIGSELSVIEQAILLDKASQWLSEQECLALLAILGHNRPGQQLIRDLVALLTLEPAVILGLHQGTVHPKTGRKLARLQPADQEVIVRLITELRLGGSKQQKLLDLASELIMRRRQPLAEILREMAPEGDRGNIPQQATALLQWLQAECTPRSHAAEREFRAFCRRLRLPAGIRLRHTPAFEDDRLFLEIEFPDRRQLEEVWPEMRQLLAGKK